MSKRFQAVFAVAMAAVMGLAAVGCSGNSASNASASASSASAEASASVASASAEASAAEATGDAYVTVDWLKDNLDSVAVVDARSASDYGATHLPGAVNLTWQQLSNVMDVEQGAAGWAELDDADTILAAAAEAGIDGSKPVVVYTDVQSGWGEDGRIMWTLREAGIEDVKILDGGWRKWVGSKGATEDGSVVAAEPVAVPAGLADADPIEQVDTAYVKEHLEDAILVDARLPQEYDGELAMGEARMGRIPGAVSLPNVSLFNQDGTLVDQTTLDALLADAGLTDKAALVITYCTGGVRGANVAEVLTDQGFTNVKVYTAGFSEWAGDEANEVEAEAEVPDASKAAA